MEFIFLTNKTDNFREAMAPPGGENLIPRHAKVCSNEKWIVRYVQVINPGIFCVDDLGQISGLMNSEKFYLPKKILIKQNKWPTDGYV